jgi:hypothetical protein
MYMSFRDIGVIINKWKEREKGLEQNDDINSKSKTTQAIKLFSEGKTTVDVVIALDLPAGRYLYDGLLHNRHPFSYTILLIRF